MKTLSYGVCPYRKTENGYELLMCAVLVNRKLLYGFFKGKVEVGESPKDAALREFREESGFTIRAEDLESKMFTASNNFKDIGIFMTPFDTEILKVEFCTREIYSVEWVNVNTVDKTFTKLQFPIFNQIKRHLTGGLTIVKRKRNDK